MKNRWLGVLAALTLVASPFACSSSTETTGTPPKDSGTDTKVTDSGKDSDAPKPVDATDTGGGEVPPPPPEDHGKIVGKACTTDDDCDPKSIGDGWARCTKTAYIVGPANPTAVCVGFGDGSSDACDPSVSLTCDGDVGFCWKSSATGAGPARCDAMCKFDKAGASLTKCLGLNACNIKSVDKSENYYGNCFGGCSKDADCPSGSKCDPYQQFCAKSCTSDATCGKITGSTIWGCDLTRSACAFKYTKKPGDACTKSDDCPCLKATADTTGQCVSICKTGDGTCPSGTVCDPFLVTKATDGTPLFSGWTKMPDGIGGYCMKTCTADTDCTAFGQVCDMSGAMTTKTCRPKP